MKSTVRWLFVGFALISMAGCGKNEEAPAFKGPVTVEQAATVLDLSTFPLVEGSKPNWPRGVASLSYEGPGDVKSAFEFQRKQLLSRGWKELPNSSVTQQSASAMFSQKGFLVSVSVFPRNPGTMSIFIQNHGNVAPGKLPRPSRTKPVYVGDASAMYVTDAGVAETKEACRNLLLADGWATYGTAGDTVDYKQNAVRVSATISSAPAQGGKTMITYSSVLMSADLPAPPEVEDLRYSEQTRELSFETNVDQKAIVDFYKKALAPAKWAPTLEHTVTIDDKEEMIFRNPAKDMLTLAMPKARDGKQSVSLQHQSAAEIAELERQIKAHEPEIKAKIAKEREEENTRWQAEHGASRTGATLPKFAITLPDGVTSLEMKNDEIKFSVGNGKAKAVVEAFRKQFHDTGWKEDAAALDAVAGAVSFSKQKQSLTINYTDAGVMPAEVILSAMGVELEASK
jgi:hypothetical protein